MPAETISAKSYRPLSACIAFCIDYPALSYAQVWPKSAQRKRREAPKFPAFSGQQSFLTSREELAGQLEFHAALGENGGKVPLGANPSGVQMGNIGLRCSPFTARLDSKDTR